MDDRAAARVFSPPVLDSSAADFAARAPALGFPLAIGAVAFDLDGTLLDTAEDLASAANAMLAELGLASLPTATIRDFVGKGLVNLVRRSLAAATGAEPDPQSLDRATELCRARYREHLCVATRPFPGVREGLEALRAAGFPMAVVTNKPDEFTVPLISRSGLAGYFGLVIGGDTLPRKKPDPLPLTHTASHFGVRPEQLLMVGDSANDALAARAAGAPVFCVPYGYSEGADVRALDCDAIVMSLRDVPSLVCKAHP
jgi:phosphoglycolate phosphatase